MIPIFSDDYKVRQVVCRAVEEAKRRYAFFDSNWQTVDEQFEIENNCKIVYDRKQNPVVLIFDEEDWFWFKAKWTEDECVG